MPPKRPARAISHAKALPDAFPSPRQARCEGLRKRLYPPHLRERVDYDYIHRLSDAERQWLAAFTEEHLKGWRLKGETQVLPVEAIREANATAKRVRLSEQARGLVLDDEPESPEDSLIRAIDRKKRRARGKRR